MRCWCRISPWGDDITVAIWECMGYTALLCDTQFKRLLKEENQS